MLTTPVSAIGNDNFVYSKINKFRKSNKKSKHYEEYESEVEENQKWINDIPSNEDSSNYHDAKVNGKDVLKSLRHQTKRIN